MTCADAPRSLAARRARRPFPPLTPDAHALLSSQNNKIEATEATNLGRDLDATTKLSASNALCCLERLELGQWLAKSDDGYYSLGVRTELQRRYTADMTQEKAEEQAGATVEVS